MEYYNYVEKARSRRRHRIATFLAILSVLVAILGVIAWYYFLRNPKNINYDKATLVLEKGY